MREKEPLAFSLRGCYLRRLSMDSKHSIALAIGVFCVLIGCSSHAAYGAPPSDPCSLLTQSQVSAVLGVQIGEGRRVAPTLCEWAIPGEAPSIRQKKVTVIIETEPGFAAAKIPVGHGTTKVPASGIGDEAVFGTTPKYATTLTVKKGAFYVAVCVYGFPLDQSKAVDEVQAKEKTLALQILSKL
jgi:hypothetical protein